MQIDYIKTTFTNKLITVILFFIMFIPAAFACDLSDVKFYIAVDTDTVSPASRDEICIKLGDDVKYYAECTVTDTDSLPNSYLLKWDYNDVSGVGFPDTEESENTPADHKDSGIYSSYTLPGTYTHNVTARLWTIDNTVPPDGIYDAPDDTTDEQTSTDVKVHVVKVDIQMQGLDKEEDDDGNPQSPNETDPGAFVGKGSSELTPVLLKIEPADLDIGEVVLTPDDGTTIEVYEDSSGTSEKYSWNLASSNPFDGSGSDDEGEFTVYVKGIELGDVNLTMTYKHDSNYDSTAEDICDDTVKVSVKDILLEWKKTGTDDSLEDCPKNGDKRIFPGKPTPSGAVNNVVDVKATLCSGASGVTIYFTRFDVDDPSSDSTVVDNDTSGPDNDGGSGSLSATSATTDSDGEATVQFTVSMQPGDNFRVFAALDNADLSSPTMDQTKADDVTSLPDEVSTTKMLTVWRKLHVEVDSMGAEYDTGTSTGINTWILTDSTKNWAANQFNSFSEDWELNPNTNNTTWFDVGNTTNTTIVATAMGPQLSGASSGDPYKVEYKGFKTGDDPMGDLPAPDTSAFEDAFYDLYIDVEFDTGNDDSDTPWHDDFDGSSKSTYAGIYRGTTESDGYWVVYVIGMYEMGFSSADNDPSSENACMGEQYGYEPEYSYVYNEIIRDVADQWSWSASEKAHAQQWVTLHEVGHQFELSDNSNTDNVMWAPGSDAPGSDASEDTAKSIPLVFNNADANTIRGTTSP